MKNRFYVVVTDDGNTQHETRDRGKAETHFASITSLGKSGSMNVVNNE